MPKPRSMEPINSWTNTGAAGVVPSVQPMSLRLPGDNDCTLFDCLLTRMTLRRFLNDSPGFLRRGSGGLVHQRHLLPDHMHRRLRCGYQSQGSGAAVERFQSVWRARARVRSILLSARRLRSSPVLDAAERRSPCGLSCRAGRRRGTFTDVRLLAMGAFLRCPTTTISCGSGSVLRSLRRWRAASAALLFQQS
jgi:hypothetical protein